MRLARLLPLFLALLLVSCFSAQAELTGDGSQPGSGGPQEDIGVREGARPPTVTPMSTPEGGITLREPVPEFESFFGRSVATGDVNGDGREDIIVGAPTAFVPVGDLLLVAGEAFVFLGGQPFDPAADYTLHDPIPEEGAGFGQSVAVGDVNGDGKDDVIVGAMWSDVASEDDGEVFIFLGGDPFDATADFTLEDPTPGSMFGDYFGESIATGDVNGDLKDDLIVGVGRYGDEVFVFLGSDPFNTMADVTLEGPVFGETFGNSVATGDVNGDLKDDIIVGAETADQGLPGFAGKAWVFLGGSPLDATLDFTLLDPNPEAFAQFGYAVDAADVTGDGKADVIVGAPYSDAGGKADAGEAFVFLGGDPFDAASDFTLQDPTPTTLAQFGFSLGAGDIDGDGKKDFIVGARMSGPSNEGEAFVFLGGSPFDATSDATLQDPNPEYAAGFGYSAAAGDVDGDTFDDAVVGADKSDVGDQEDAGEAFVFLGGSPPLADSDGDGFTDAVELYLPTDPLDDCPDWTDADIGGADDCPGPTCDGHDAWPLDNNVDRFVTVVGDVLNYRGRIGATPGAPNWLQRLDLNGDGAITVAGDALLYREKIGQGCT